MLHRQIDRQPTCPPLSPKSERLLETLCFGPAAGGSYPEFCDVMLALGTGHSVERLVEAARLAIQSSQVGVLIATGGIPAFVDSKQRTETESREFLRLLNPDAFPGLSVLDEPCATNLKENVEFSKALIPHLEPRVIAFVMKSHSIGRTEATIRKSFPTATLHSVSYDADFGMGLLTRASWRDTTEYRARVWGEFLRIREYGARGDIKLSTDQEQLVREISRAVHSA